MGFDKNDPRPIVQPEKRTTKVNFAIIGGVLLFFALSFAVLFWYRANPHKAAENPSATGK